MTHYLSNLKDIRFNLFEVFGRNRLLGTGPWADLDMEMADEMLRASVQLAESDLAVSFPDDEIAVEFDQASGTVLLPEAFKKSYQRYVDAEWWRMDVDPAIGGIATPPSLRWAMAEFPMGANPSILFYAAGWPQAQILFEQGTEEQKHIAELMVERKWGGTMVLTEPDAGSAVGSGTTRAVPQNDNTWHLEGTKRFITSADHDMAENIVHFVLARPVDTPGAGGPGTKGLSLFLVPKFLFDAKTGDLGVRNGAIVTNVERKMGLEASATCELTFGQERPAVGYLVGGVHRGIEQMFDIVEYARMLVGTKATATLSTGYLNALEYAKIRLQSPDLTRRGDPSAPDVPIIKHPDVRRSLMSLKAYSEGMRALVTFSACVLDDISLAKYEGRDSADFEARNDLLLPIVKAYCSEQGYSKLADALQVFGGSGYLRDYPIEQYIRDAKIDTIYEGTTAIQGIDFFFRKIVRDEGRAIQELFREIEEHIGELTESESFQRIGAKLHDALADVRAVIAIMREWASEAKERSEVVYRVGLQTTRLVMMTGELMLGWLLSRQALVAQARLQEVEASLPEADVRFYEGKIAVAQFFADQHLPAIASERKMLESGEAVFVMDIADESF